jgi:AraC-like DNA-binding protein
MTLDLIPIPVGTYERLAGLGVDVARVLAHADMPSSSLAGAPAHVSTREFFAFWRALGEVGGIRDAGLRIGGEASPHATNVARMAMLHAANLGEALKRLARYKRLVCPEHITVDIARGEARVRYKWFLTTEEPPPLLVDGIYASVVSVARQGTGMPVAPRRLDLARRRNNETALRRFFHCDVHFDAAEDVLVFDEKTLLEPFVTRDAVLSAKLIPELEASLRARGAARSIADDVRAALSERICGERPAVERVAKALAMSPRTLQRRLGELGTSYQKLLDDVRRRSARRLLANTDLESAEVAFLLGFEELNSFTRAFHGWEGTTPLRWRAKAGGRISLASER